MGISLKLQLIQRAKHKKAWVVERHNEILRNACHKSQTQLAVEGVEIKVSHVLVEAVYSNNALLTIGEGAPYIALLGRVPPLLPQIEHIAGLAQLNDKAGVEGSRHVRRLRAVAVSSMVETLAERRPSLSSQQGPSPLPGELLALRPGDQVEFYRRTTKDRPAWGGPATVNITDRYYGKVTVQRQGRNIDVSLESGRRAMIFATFFLDDTFQA